MGRRRKRRTAGGFTENTVLFPITRHARPTTNRTARTTNREKRLEMTDTNIDAAEVAKFARMARTWWDPSGPLKSLHDINPLRSVFIEEHIPLTGARILDVGCGGGILSETLAKRGAEVTGIDAAAESVGAARFHAAETGLPIVYRQSTVEEFAASGPHDFDAVLCMELLEHVPDPSSVVSACGRLARPEGKVVFATLNRNAKSYLFAIVGAEMILGLLERGTHRWRRFVKPSELDSWAGAANLLPFARTGLHYNPFTRRYFLGGNLDVNYMTVYRRPVPPSTGVVAG
jgi:2-polyprenyl-6-hydroxyphenyl methylase/3-demethylubiquinone-9 3-methyltransferase